MRRLTGVGLLVILLVGMTSAVFALPNVSPFVSESSQNVDIAEACATSAGFKTSVNELDDQVQLGDTLVVGLNMRDQQHNAGFGRMIAYDNAAENPTVYLTWTYHETVSSSRYVKYAEINFDQDGKPVVATIEGGMTVGVAGAGYPVMDLDPETKDVYGVFHQSSGASGGTASMIWYQNAFVSTIFDTYEPASHSTASPAIWPQMSLARHDGNLYAHVISNGHGESYDNTVFYHRARFNGTAWENATPGDASQVVVTEKSKVLATIPVVSNDGSKVAVVGASSRFLAGEGPLAWEDKRASQANNDIYAWISEDGGDTWDWDNPLNVTNFVGPDIDLMPDTIAASKDTMRTYAEVEAIFDADNVLHIGIPSQPFVYYEVLENGGAVSMTNRLFHWDNDRQLFSQIADGTFFNGAKTSTWESIIAHCNFYKDESTGILWAVWAQHGEPEGYEIVEDQLHRFDASDDGFANTDLWVAASPDNGLRWTKGVNVTNTKSEEWDLEVGDSRSERDPSMARNNDGDYLHFFYTLDMDAGIALPGGNSVQGEPTENQMVYHRVSKQELMAKFEEQAEWVPNYKLHVNGDNYYEDPNNWEWNGFWGGTSVDDEATLAPEQFELSQNYPNPFNPSTKISFTLQATGHVKLAVYDVLGREVATLMNRSLSAGQHSVNFMASDLPSGVYFYKMTSGSNSQIRKMILMK